MAAFTFYGASLKGFRVGFDLQQNLVVSRCAASACAFVLRRVQVGDVVLVALAVSGRAMGVSSYGEQAAKRTALIC
jgi:hypothetical protein